MQVLRWDGKEAVRNILLEGREHTSLEASDTAHCDQGQRLILQKPNDNQMKTYLKDERRR